MNSKSFGKARQAREVFWPGVALTLFHFMLKTAPAPINGVTPSLENAETRRVLNVPGPVLRTLPETVQLLEVNPTALTGAVRGVGAATAESKSISAWKPI